MIVVVEGPSAAGKTTWCRTHFPGTHVPEATDVGDEWAAASAQRWAAAVDMETRTGLAVCDTDPFKLHHAWGMWRSGQLAEDRWRREHDAARAAFGAGELGFADVALVAIPDEAVLRARHEGDATRSRRSFERHVRLAGPLREWYAVVDAVDPGRVRWELPAGGLPGDLPAARDDRCSVDLFDAVISALPQR